jgi:hypothetical protein
MPIRVLKDGQMVDRLGGYSGIGPSGKKTYSGFTTVEHANTVLQDEEVAEHLLELVKAGGHPGLVYVADEGDGEDIDGDDGELKDALDAAKARISELESELEAAEERIAELEGDEDKSDGSGSDAEYGDIEGYDPSEYNQPQVLDYLKGASPDEVKRVQDAEKSGQNRQQIMGYKAE